MTRSTLRSALSGALAVFALGLVGCIKVDDETTIAADGSGTLAETFTLDLSAMKEIEAMFKGMLGPAADGAAMDGAAMDGAPAKPEEKPKEDPLAKLKTEWKDIPGIEVTKATEEEKDGKITVHVEAKFTSLEAYAKASQIEVGSELTKGADGSYTLKFSGDYGMDADMAGGGKPEGPAMGDDPKPAGMDGAKPDDPMGLGALTPILEKALAGLEFNRKLTLPGAIVETNGTKGEDGSTVSWKVTFEDIKKGKKEPQTVTFKGEGLDLKPFKVERKHKEIGMGPGGGPPGAPGAPLPK